MIDEEELMDIKALHRQGHTYAEIGRLLGRDWRTVKRYLTEGAQPIYRREKRPSKLDPFKDIIEGWLEKEPRLRARTSWTGGRRDGGSGGGLGSVARRCRRIHTSGTVGLDNARAVAVGIDLPLLRSGNPHVWPVTYIEAGRTTWPGTA